MKSLVILFVVLLAAIVLAADRGQLPGFVVALYSFPGGDKVGHFVLMGILSFLVNFSLAVRSRSPRRILYGSLVLAAVVTAEEVTQLFFRSRTFSWADLASSYAGIVCFACLASWAVRRRVDRGPSGE